MRFLNQKLGKRTSRRLGQIKSQVSSAHRPALRAEPRLPKKGASHENRALSPGQGKKL